MRFPVRTSRLEQLDLVELPQRKAYIVETFEQSPCGLVVNLERQHRRSRGDISILKIGSDFQARTLLDELPKKFHPILGDFGRQQPRLARVTPKNVTKSRRDNHPESVVHERPHRMLARRA